MKSYSQNSCISSDCAGDTIVWGNAGRRARFWIECWLSLEVSNPFHHLSFPRNHKAS